MDWMTWEPGLADLEAAEKVIATTPQGGLWLGPRAVYTVDHTGSRLVLCDILKRPCDHFHQKCKRTFAKFGYKVVP